LLIKVKLTEKIQPGVKLGFEMETIVGMETDHKINEVDKLGYGPLINGMRAISKQKSLFSAHNFLIQFFPQLGSLGNKISL
jgi:hypothetical protein